MLDKIANERKITPTISEKIDSSSSLLALPGFFNSLHASQVEHMKPRATAMGKRKSKVEPND
jgi:hypothetical protein